VGTMKTPPSRLDMQLLRYQSAAIQMPRQAQMEQVLH